MKDNRREAASTNQGTIDSIAGALFDLAYNRAENALAERLVSIGRSTAEGERYSRLGANPIRVGFTWTPIDNAPSEIVTTDGCIT